MLVFARVALALRAAPERQEKEELLRIRVLEVVWIGIPEQISNSQGELGFGLGWRFVVHWNSKLTFRSLDGSNFSSAGSSIIWESRDEKGIFL